MGSFSEAGDKIQTDLLLDSEIQIMGRKTYEGFAMVWPTRGGTPYGDHINAMPEYVFSSQLTDPAWENTTVISSIRSRRCASSRSRTAATSSTTGSATSPTP